jgi:Uma2 family endonuclease
VVEIADAAQMPNRQFKLRVYARARIPVYWIINLVASRIELYTQPKAGKAPGYRQRQEYGPEDTVPLVLASQEVGQIPVRELLPGAVFV